MTHNHKKWLFGSLTLLMGLGTVGYFLYRKKMQVSSSPLFGNGITAISGGVATNTGNSGQAVHEPNWDNPFNMNYEKDVKQWVLPQTVASLNDTLAQELAQTLLEAKGSYFWEDDDETAVKDVFQKRLRDKVQVSALARVFWLRYQKDLWVFLKDFLSSTELEAYVTKPVRLLSNYTKNNAS